ncbi:hypothetical protein EIN_059770 [Entamoeba invadens IP1]|uniref:hypothetical protein n=1 Tax=Entamoeba invadens IP1 TaxID=370355 RepID=UPI0002C3FA02|nr:hypothetical protein EIN_059770 [Entamoeba invadens IP1]ELP93482.1 hypothetical protein EIN_059770 [Entamoeba invadens IP1]|eukprot:XP_004260253.1 hypothetical protein EIN_059770 [Entamoeba invadens IP1]
MEVYKCKILFDGSGMSLIDSIKKLLVCSPIIYTNTAIENSLVGILKPMDVHTGVEIRLLPNTEILLGKFCNVLESSATEVAKFCVGNQPPIGYENTNTAINEKPYDLRSFNSSGLHLKRIVIWSEQIGGVNTSEVLFPTVCDIEDVVFENVKVVIINKYEHVKYLALKNTNLSWRSSYIKNEFLFCHLEELTIWSVTGLSLPKIDSLRKLSLNMVTNSKFDITEECIAALKVENCTNISLEFEVTRTNEMLISNVTQVQIFPHCDDDECYLSLIFIECYGIHLGYIKHLNTLRFVKCANINLKNVPKCESLVIQDSKMKDKYGKLIDEIESERISLYDMKLDTYAKFRSAKILEFFNLKNSNFSVETTVCEELLIWYCESCRFQLEPCKLKKLRLERNTEICVDADFSSIEIYEDNTLVEEQDSYLFAPKRVFVSSFERPKLVDYSQQCDDNLKSEIIDQSSVALTNIGYREIHLVINFVVNFTLDKFVNRKFPIENVAFGSLTISNCRFYTTHIVEDDINTHKKLHSELDKTETTASNDIANILEVKRLKIVHSNCVFLLVDSTPEKISVNYSSVCLGLGKKATKLAINDVEVVGSSIAWRNNMRIENVDLEQVNFEKIDSALLSENVKKLRIANVVQNIDVKNKYRQAVILNACNVIVENCEGIFLKIEMFAKDVLLKNVKNSRIETYDNKCLKLERCKNVKEVKGGKECVLFPEEKKSCKGEVFTLNPFLY